jgi:hypothetical protein
MDPHQQQLGSQQEEAIPETQLGQPSSGEPSGSQQQGGDEGAAAPALSILSDLFAEVWCCRSQQHLLSQRCFYSSCSSY